MANIVLKNINKIYPNNVHAVIDFNLEIKDKEFIVFVGPSGCGKSTTLRMIAGLEDISSGEFYIDGKLMNYVPPKDRNISMVFQNYALYPHMSVYRNMAYSLTINKSYLPIFEKSEELDSLKKKLLELKKKSNDISKALSKKEEDSLVDEYLSNYKEIEDVLEQIYKVRKPIIGNDIKRIKRLTKEIKEIDEEISFVSSLLGKEKRASNEEKDDEFVSMLLKDLESIKDSKKEKEAILKEISSSPSEILKKRKLYPYEIDYEVYHAARILDLAKYLSRFPSELSGGQRQRVALGRAIVRKPKVFLMDEPLSNLDAKLRVQTRAEIASIHKAVGATTIYVTHDQVEAMTLADRIVIMKDGIVQQIDKPMKAFEDPNNMFVAGFIGSPSMNFLKGTIKDNKFIFSHVKKEDEFELELSKVHVSILKDYENKEVILGIRPEDIDIANDDSDIQFALKSVELLGNEFILYGDFDSSPIAVKTNKPISPDIKEKLKFKINREKLYFFDALTQERIR